MSENQDSALAMFICALLFFAVAWGGYTVIGKYEAGITTRLPFLVVLLYKIFGKWGTVGVLGLVGIFSFWSGIGFLRKKSSPDLEDADPLNYDNMVFLDAEDLAEQGILSAYQKLLPRLKLYKLHMSSHPIEVSEEIDNDLARYIVHANEKRYVIQDGEDGGTSQDYWVRATVAFFEIVNANLKGSQVKFYALYGGNDLGGMFLSEEQYAAARRALKRRSDWPWLPVNEPPHYGYPNASAV